MSRSGVINQSRRSFLKNSAAVGGGLVLGFYLPVTTASAKSKAQGVTPSPTQFVPNAWLRVGSDDSITIFLVQLEMGQGVMTSMPMMIAEELDADWTKVNLQFVGFDLAYGDPARAGRLATAGSRSTRNYWKMVREAGAAGRAMLVSAAAQNWGVPESSLSTEMSSVIHSASGRRASYGSLAEKAATLPVPKQVALKDPDNFRILGRPLARVDIPEKVDGSAVYGMDVKTPNALTARVLRCPVFGGKVASFNADRAKKISGVRNVVQISSGVAVVADNFWAATQGIKALEVKWDEGPNANLSSDQIRRRFVEASEKPGAVARDDGNFAKAYEGAAKHLEAVYEVPYLAHATMEPQNCTADVRKDSCDIWVSTQSQTSAHDAGVKITGLAASAVKIHPMFMGGGFGRRGENDFVAEAVETSKLIGRPVKVIWSREDDMQHDFYRPATYVRFWAALDKSGMPVAWMQRLVQPSINARNDLSVLEKTRGVDISAVTGAVEMPYNIPNVRVEYVYNDPGIPLGFWRSVGGSVNGYVVESFFDEVAVAAGKDPFEFRRQLLDKSPRNKAALELAAEKAGWGKPLPPGMFRGISVIEGFDSFAAEVAEVAVEPDGHLRIHRIIAAVDCGWTSNPDTIAAQMESGIAYGLTAMKGEITIKNGRVEQSHFENYPMLKLNEMPMVETYVVPSKAAPGGIGETSTPPLFSAVVNAFYAATGKRIRRLPLHPEDLRRA